MPSPSTIVLLPNSAKTKSTSNLNDSSNKKLSSSSLSSFKNDYVDPDACINDTINDSCGSFKENLDKSPVMTSTYKPASKSAAKSFNSTQDYDSDDELISQLNDFEIKPLFSKSSAKLFQMGEEISKQFSMKPNKASSSSKSNADELEVVSKNLVVLDSDIDDDIICEDLTVNPKPSSNLNEKSMSKKKNDDLYSNEDDEDEDIDDDDIEEIVFNTQKQASKGRTVMDRDTCSVEKNQLVDGIYILIFIT